jgi:cytochrome c biogenesis protein CcdA
MKKLRYTFIDFKDIVYLHHLTILMNFIQLILILTGTALLDSINPSAIVMTIGLLSTGKRVRHVLSYIFGIMVTNFTFGLVVLSIYKYSGNSFNFDLSGINELVNKPPMWAIYCQLVAGLCLLTYPFWPKSKKAKVVKPDKKLNSNRNSLLGYFLLGVTITGIEATTALPYFGAISVLFLANYPMVFNAMILLGYNLIFVMPPLVILGIAVLFRNKFDCIISKLQLRIAKHLPKIIFVGTITLSFVMIVDSVWRLI